MNIKTLCLTAVLAVTALSGLHAQSNPNLGGSPPPSTWDGPTIISSGNIGYESNYSNYPTNPWGTNWNGADWALSGGAQVRGGRGYITNSGGVTFRYTLHPAILTYPSKNSWTVKTQVYASASGTNINSGVVAGGITNTNTGGSSLVNTYQYLVGIPYQRNGIWTLDVGTTVWGHVEQVDVTQPWSGDVWVGLYTAGGSVPY